MEASIQMMSAPFNFNQFKRDDVEKVVWLWGELLKPNILSAESLLKYTFSHPDFDPAGCFVARKNGKVVGFIMATVMRIPEVKADDFPGCIAVLMVHPDCQKQGIASALLKKGEAYLRAQGKQKIVAGYPTYIRGSVLSLIGVEANRKEAFWFFRHYGFKETEILDSAKVSLENFEIPEYVLETEKIAAKESIATGVLTDSSQASFLSFLQETFPESWYAQFAERIPKGQVVLDNVLILTRDERIIGFVGPFDVPKSGIAALGLGIGLKEEFRARGLGDVILFRALEMIRNKGGNQCWIFGVGPKRYYEKAGFKMTQLWIQMEKSLHSQS